PPAAGSTHCFPLFSQTAAAAVKDDKSAVVGNAFPSRLGAHFEGHPILTASPGRQGNCVRSRANRQPRSSEALHKHDGRQDSPDGRRNLLSF
ncbi:MAG TPA: hypothetical protein VIJ65_08895, partial [Acidobacteriaceae bacterium]